MATLEKVQAQIAKLQAQAESIIAKESSGVLERIRGLMEKHNLTTIDIESYVAGKSRGRKPRTDVSRAPTVSRAKYLNPKTGATWTGHGRAPAWIADAKNRDRFLIASDVTSTVPTTSGGKGKGNFVRGPQPAKYRDPETGASWSGRGRVPAWLNGVSDRTAYLFAGAEGDLQLTKAKRAVKSDVKKSVTKKAVV